MTAGAVFVAAAVFLGVAGSSVQARAEETSLAVQREAQPAPAGGSRITGQVKERYGTMIVVVLRGGRTVRVDLTRAIQGNTVVVANPGMFVQVEGMLTPTGMMAAYVMRRAKSSSAAWTPDIG